MMKKSDTLVAAIRKATNKSQAAAGRAFIKARQHRRVTILATRAVIAGARGVAPVDVPQSAVVRALDEALGPDAWAWAVMVTYNAEQVALRQRRDQERQERLAKRRQERQKVRQAA